MANRISVANLLLLLQEDPISITQIREQTGMGKLAAYAWINLLKRKKLIRIAEWKNGYKIPWTAYYQWNFDGGRDAPRPTPRPRPQVYKDYRARRKQKLKVGVSSCQK